MKPTAGGRAYIEEVVEAPPYPGAKLSLVIEDPDRGSTIAERAGENHSSVSE